jgi:hypothetical protein
MEPTACLGCGAVFIPSLALAPRIWTGSHETCWLTCLAVWCLGVANPPSCLDFARPNGWEG